MRVKRRRTRVLSSTCAEYASSLIWWFWSYLSCCPFAIIPGPGGVKSFVLLPGWWAIPASTQRPSFRRHNRVCVFMIYWFDEVSTSHAPLKGESLLSLPSPSAGAFFVLCVTGRPVCVCLSRSSVLLCTCSLDAGGTPTGKGPAAVYSTEADCDERGGPRARRSAACI